MSSWLLTLLLSTAFAAEPDDAAATLSRYPAGLVPDSEPVMSAIAVLSMQGEPAHRAVLESLQEMEKPPVAHAAADALSAIDRRERRETYTAPDTRQVRRWLTEQPAPLTRADGSPVGRTEQEALGYAALVLGAPQGTTGHSDLIHDAALLEDRGETTSALTLYARAASQGSDEALATLRDFGVDPELLLLGMSVSTEDALVTSAPPEALDVLIREGSSSTVAVLIERADSANHIDRAVALDALAEMLRTTSLPASARRSARNELERAATSGPQEALSAFARESLADMEW